MPQVMPLPAPPPPNIHASAPPCLSPPPYSLAYTARREPQMATESTSGALDTALPPPPLLTGIHGNEDQAGAPDGSREHSWRA